MKRSALRQAAMLGLFGTVAGLYPSVAKAEDASAAETAAARSLAVEGLRLAQANNCADAVPKLERAEKLYHSAVVASRLGECYVSVGRLVEGTEVLRKVLREPLPADATPALSKALDRAQRALDAAKPRIAGLTLKVAAVPDMHVKIDGKPLPSALLDSEVPTDPGEHSIEVSAPGYLRSGARISVTDGEKKSVTLTLWRDPNAVVAPAPKSEAAALVPTSAPAASEAEPRAPVASSSPATARGPNRTAAYLALGIGAAGVAAGGVLGVLTLQRHEDLQGRCPNDVCASDQQSNLDGAKQLGNFSTIAFGVGGAGLVLGSVLFFTADPSKVDHAETTPRRRFAGLSDPYVAVGPTQVRLGADF
jgi:PEGA domain